MSDLTAITTPFGLLDAETQEALKEHGGPYELWRGGYWGDAGGGEEFDTWYTYRVKPQPPKPREFWISHDRQIVTKYFHADFIHVREVLE